MQHSALSKSRSLLSTLCFVGAVSCSDPADAGGGALGGAAYPRQVALEYKVTSTTGIATALVRYTNDSGGEATVDDAPLPFSATLTRSVKQYDIVKLGASASNGGALTTELLVDGKPVDTKTSSGTSSVTAVSMYSFP